MNSRLHICQCPVPRFSGMQSLNGLPAFANARLASAESVYAMLYCPFSLQTAAAICSAGMPSPSVYEVTVQP